MLNTKIIYIFAPHPDDEIFACGGMIANKISESYQIKVVIISNGDKSHRLYKNPILDNLAKIRKHESISALKILGVNTKNIIFLNYKDKSLSFNKKPITNKLLPLLTNDLNLIKEVYFPHICSKHTDHSASSEVIHHILNTIKYCGLRYMYIIWEDNNQELIGQRIKQDISSQIKLKTLAISKFKSQITKFIPEQLKPVLSQSFINKRLINFEFFYIYKDVDFSNKLQKEHIQKISSTISEQKSISVKDTNDIFSLKYQLQDVAILLLGDIKLINTLDLSALLSIRAKKNLSNAAKLILILGEAKHVIQHINKNTVNKIFFQLPILVIADNFDISLLNTKLPTLFYLNSKHLTKDNKAVYFREILLLIEKSIKSRLSIKENTLKFKMIEIFQYFSFDTKEGGVYDICYHKINQLTPLAITKQVKLKYITNSPLKPNQERWCKRIIASLAIKDNYRLFSRIISSLEELPFIGQHLINACSVDQYGGHEIRYIDGINLSLIDKLKQLPIDQLGLLFNAIDTLKNSLKKFVQSDQLSGDWGLQNLIYSLFDNTIYNIDNEGFYTYPFIHRNTNNNNYSFIIENLDNTINLLTNPFNISKSLISFKNTYFFSQYRILETLTHNTKRSTFIIQKKTAPFKTFFLKHITKSVNVNINKEIENSSILNNMSESLKFHQLHVSNEGIFLLFEYKEALNLEAYIKLHGVLSEKELFNLLKDILEYLAFFKKNNLLHLDLKPANILYDGKRFYLIDMGSSSSGPCYHTQYLNFNKYYLPPETYTGLRCFSSEIYQLACIIFYAAKGNISTLFGIPKASTDQIIFAHLFSNPQIPRHISNKLKIILSGMLDKDPINRISIDKIYQSLNSSENVVEPIHTAVLNINIPETARAIYQYLADHDIAVGEYNIGLYYLKGDYYQKDLISARKYLTKAANKDLACAQYELACLLLNNIGSEKDLQEGYQWLEKSALKNYNQAHYKIAQILLHDKSKFLNISPHDANYWFIQAAKEGFFPAYQLLNLPKQKALLSILNLSDQKSLYKFDDNIGFELLVK